MEKIIVWAEEEFIKLFNNKSRSWIDEAIFMCAIFETLLETLSDVLDNGRGKGGPNMATDSNNGAKQAVLRSMDKISNNGRATREISHPSHSL